MEKKFTCYFCNDILICLPNGQPQKCRCGMLTIDYTEEYIRYTGTLPTECLTKDLQIRYDQIIGITYQTKCQKILRHVYDWIVSLCKKRSEVDDSHLFIQKCTNGSVAGMQSYLKKHPHLDINEGLRVSVKNKQNEVVQYLLNQGATNLDECLEIACEKNFAEIAEMLVQKGANVLSGLRVAKSLNIINILEQYRFRNNY